MKKSNLYLSIIIAFSFGIVHGQTSLFNSKTKTPKADSTYQLSLVKANEGNKEVTINTAKALSSIHYYQNSEGNTIQAPTKYNKVPASATALCRDGTYSFSQHARGTCSHHGGVAKKL